MPRGLSKISTKSKKIRERHQSKRYNLENDHVTRRPLSRLSVNNCQKQSFINQGRNTSKKLKKLLHEKGRRRDWYQRHHGSQPATRQNSATGNRVNEIQSTVFNHILESTSNINRDFTDCPPLSSTVPVNSCLSSEAKKQSGNEAMQASNQRSERSELLDCLNTTWSENSSQRLILNKTVVSSSDKDFNPWSTHRYTNAGFSLSRDFYQSSKHRHFSNNEPLSDAELKSVDLTLNHGTNHHHVDINSEATSNTVDSPVEMIRSRAQDLLTSDTVSGTVFTSCQEDGKVKVCSSSSAWNNTLHMNTPAVINKQGCSKTTIDTGARTRAKTYSNFSILFLLNKDTHVSSRHPLTDYKFAQFSSHETNCENQQSYGGPPDNSLTSVNEGQCDKISNSTMEDMCGSKISTSITENLCDNIIPSPKNNNLCNNKIRTHINGDLYDDKLSTSVKKDLCDNKISTFINKNLCNNELSKSINNELCDNKLSTYINNDLCDNKLSTSINNDLCNNKLSTSINNDLCHNKLSTSINNDLCDNELSTSINNDLCHNNLSTSINNDLCDNELSTSTNNDMCNNKLSSINKGQCDMKLSTYVNKDMCDKNIRKNINDDLCLREVRKISRSSQKEKTELAIETEEINDQDCSLREPRSATSTPGTEVLPTEADTTQPEQKEMSDHSDLSIMHKMTRYKYTQEQITLLNHHFNNNRYPSYDDLLSLSQESSVPVRQLQVWFQNKRASTTGTRKPKNKRTFENPVCSTVYKTQSHGTCDQIRSYPLSLVLPASYYRSPLPHYAGDVHLSDPTTSLRYRSHLHYGSLMDNRLQAYEHQGLMQNEHRFLHQSFGFAHEPQPLGVNVPHVNRYLASLYGNTSRSWPELHAINSRGVSLPYLPVVGAQALTNSWPASYGELITGLTDKTGDHNSNTAASEPK